MMINALSRIALLGFLVTLSAGTSSAIPFSFDSASSDIQEYVVESITNCIRTASIALMHERTDEALREEDELMPWSVGWELGLRERRCVEMLKGDVSSAGYKICYLYQSPRDAGEMAAFVGDVFSNGKVSGFRYYKDGKYSCGKGKDIWKIFPPYDPFSSYGDEFVQLMFLTPEKELDVGRVRFDKHSHKDGSIVRMLGRDPIGMTSKELMRELHLERAFSNRIFRVNDGCAFQVDYPVPDLDWRRVRPTKEEHLVRLKRIQAGNSVLMHLSHDEVSEIILLAYMVDGKMDEYASACRRYPKILKPVERLRTTIGILLYRAMSKGGMLVNDCLLKTDMNDFDRYLDMLGFEIIENQVESPMLKMSLRDAAWLMWESDIVFPSNDMERAEWRHPVVLDVAQLKINVRERDSARFDLVKGKFLIANCEVGVYDTCREQVKAFLLRYAVRLCCSAPIKFSILDGIEASYIGSQTNMLYVTERGGLRG